MGQTRHLLVQNKSSMAKLSFSSPVVMLSSVGQVKRTGIFKKQTGAGEREIAQQLRALSILPGDPGSVLSTHMVAKTICNSTPRTSDAPFWPPHSHGT